MPLTDLGARHGGSGDPGVTVSLKYKVQLFLLLWSCIRYLFHTVFLVAMRLQALSFVSLFVGGVLAAPKLTPFSTFSNVTVFVPPSNYTDPQVLYARTVELEGGVLLATWENYSPEPPLVYAPIFKSIDGGETWKEIAKVQDQVNGWGLRYQPFLYELPTKVGKYPAGTVLLATNSIPTDLNYTKIDIYASLDKGYTWKFVSQ